MSKAKKIRNPGITEPACIEEWSANNLGRLCIMFKYFGWQESYRHVAAAHASVVERKKKLAVVD